MTHGGNLYGSYRREGRTFYFVIDDNRPELDRYHFGALQKKRREWILTSAYNDGDKVVSWDHIVGVYPQLDGEIEKFVDKPLSEDELEKGNILNVVNERPGPNEFARQSRQRQLQYLTLDRKSTRLNSSH